MRPPLRQLGFIFTVLAVCAYAEEEPPIPKTSENNTAAVAPSPKVSRQIISGLPKYSPAQTATAEPAKGGDGPGGAMDPDLLVLPTMVVKQKPRPRLTNDVVYKSKEDFGAIFAKQNYTQLDLALNKFTLPLFGSSLEARAYDDYMRAKNAQMQEDVKHLSKAVEAIDAAEAKAIRDAAAKP